MKLTAKKLLLGAPLILLPSAAQAICPLCVIAVGAGLGLSEYLGIDDTISGSWIGALIVAMAWWNINWFESKKIWNDKRQMRNVLTILAYYLLVVAPLFWQGLIGQPGKTIFGIDKLALGITVGSIVFVLSEIWYNKLKQKNNGRALFPFQKVVTPIMNLAIVDLLFYLLIR
ncbi:MAG: hypothetical protein NT165_03855 [Candidatus Falkowbacteria bacterium]|nr:hypothetical protein [Candidatus Falkowbacteria bacterium]